jgi:hypothetical protein
MGCISLKQGINKANISVQKTILNTLKCRPVYLLTKEKDLLKVECKQDNNYQTSSFFSVISSNA